MDMITPPKIPGADRRPLPPRVVVPLVIVLAALGVTAMLFLPPMWSDAVQPEAAQPEPMLTSANAGELCLRLSENPKDYMSHEALERRWALRSESCKLAFAEHPENLHFKVAVARAMPYAQREAKVALFREAAAQGDAEAYYELYEHHKSWDRGDLDQVPLVTRAEADRSLHKAAELGHPFSTQMLAILLDRGTTVKRDPAAARYWAGRAVANPAKDTSAGDLLVLLGRLLVTSDKPDERGRGLDILERMAKAGAFGAKRELAIAIRKDDPVRARKLLEESLWPDPGGAPPRLAEMLIAGEGGPADPKRALVAAEQTHRHDRRQGRARTALSGRQTGGPRRPAGSGAARPGRRMGPRCPHRGGANPRRQPRGPDHKSKAPALLRHRGRGTGRARRDGRADRPQTVAKHPVSGPARSL